jgi:hypothetical protein
MNFNIVKIAKAERNIGMEPIRLPSDEEIGAAYDQSKEAVIALFNATFRKLGERMQALEGQLAKDSRNSRKPPASDGLKMNMPCSTPLISTNIFSEILPASGFPYSSRKGAGLPGLSANRNAKRINRSIIQMETVTRMVRFTLCAIERNRVFICRVLNCPGPSLRGITILSKITFGLSA